MPLPTFVSVQYEDFNPDDGWMMQAGEAGDRALGSVAGAPVVRREEDQASFEVNCYNEIF